MSNPNWWAKLCGIVLLWAMTAVALPAQTFKSILSFDGTDGMYPNALVQGTDGNLYGTTAVGGANINSSCPSYSGCGTVFRITTAGKLTTLYNFCGQGNCADGSQPIAGLVQGTDGNFYGTTDLGGANDSCNYGCGTVFRVTAGGTLTTLYSFCAQTNCTDGTNPGTALIQGTDRNFYGTTVHGGANGDGTVFSITPNGTLTTLYSFCAQTDCTDGYYPFAPLIQGGDGTLYGTTYWGGAYVNSCTNGCGTVFSITTGGTLATLYSFCQQIENGVCADGQYPAGGLVQGTDGNLYGTTQGRGGSGCVGMCGTVFSITAGGTLTTLYSFLCTAGGEGSCPNGDVPQTGLALGTDGNFYGTTFLGGAYCHFGCGTLFSITAGGVLTTLHSFGVGPGLYPDAALIQDTNGMFYGTTQQGGTNGDTCGFNCGTIFRLSMGLGSFVETQPISGAVGTAVKILGTNLTGTTSVTFNGTAATFIVKSKSEITTTVPAGATTGTVQVVTPANGTLSSNVPFTVN